MRCSFLSLLFLANIVSSMHFYMKPGETKCFYENLTQGHLLIGDFDAFVLRDAKYEEDFGIKLTITVDETFDNDHRVLIQKNSHTGDFTFTALETGEHRICIKPTYSTMDAKLRIFMELDISNMLSLDSKRTIQVRSLKERVLQLTERLERIRTQQKEILQKEAVFRDQSESANRKILLWSLVQVLVLISTCTFQLRYLKNFFIKQKVV